MKLAPKTPGTRHTLYLCPMHILLVAATPFEISPVCKQLEETNFRVQNHQISVSITGIGSMMTAYNLTKSICQQRPDFIIQAGIAGSLDANLSAPTVVIVKEEYLADLGAAEGNQFADIFDLGLLKDSMMPFNNRKLVNPTSLNQYGLPQVIGITVNEVSTSVERIEWYQQRYYAAVESMEGAALHYVALLESIPFIQLRAISNVVGERNKENWNMQEAITALNESLIKLLKELYIP